MFKNANSVTGFASMLLLIGGTIGGGLVGCATPATDIYLRSDLDTTKSKVVVFPLLLLKGGNLQAANVKFSNPAFDAVFLKGWSGELGGENPLVVPKAALDKVPGMWDAMDKLVSVLDNTSAIEQSFKGTPVAEVMKKLGEQVGDGALALALVAQDENEFKKDGTLRGHMGLFDTKALTWKWISKYNYTTGMIPVPYAVAVQKLFDSSFDEIKKKNSGRVR